MVTLAYLLVTVIASPEGNSLPWFAKDSKGQSCASCHSADGIEVRLFSEADIVRRTARHHTGATAEAIRAMVSKGTNSQAKNGREFRPMQPGGVVLAGANAAARDAAFLNLLVQRYPGLLKPVDSYLKALEFQRQVLAINLHDLPIGIQFNRLSEDSARGNDHASIANWFADIPTFDSDQIQPAAEGYLANPTEANLKALDAKVAALAKPKDQFAQLSLAKFRCLNVLQHEIRTRTRSSFLPEGNPFWQVAEVGRLFAESDWHTLGVPDEIAKAKQMDQTFGNQMKQLRLPWFWLGWIRDPSLTHSGLMRETLRADYFCQYLEQDGPYMSHELFMLTRKLAEQNRSPLLPDAPWEIQYSFFLANRPLIEREPKDGSVQNRFRQLARNSFMMSLYLLDHDIETRGKSIRPIPQMSQVKFLSQYLDSIGMPAKTLVDRVNNRLKRVANG